MTSTLSKCYSCIWKGHPRLTPPLSLETIQTRSFLTSRVAEAGGKNKIKVSGKGRLKDHPLGGPGMEEAFDIERDLVKPFASQDVPGVTHLRWAEARKRLHALRVIKFQMPALAKFRQPFVPPDPNAHLIVKTHDDMEFHHGQADSQRPNRKVTVRLNLSRFPELIASPEAMHKIKLIAGARWTAPTIRSAFDTNEHYDDPHGSVTIACDKYPSRAMNERWCSETVNRLLVAATAPEADKMSDIPLDLRPSIQRRRRNCRQPWKTSGQDAVRFPLEWLTPASRARLEARQMKQIASAKHYKQALNWSDAELRKLINWDGIGLAPIGLFDKLEPDAKRRLAELIDEREHLRASLAGSHASPDV
ncbi:hypothetical protein CROQUDRAFT_719395 [Cronartium quercuum f. sp. fusiforme G11]|uniref:Small ribosomal subunit protein mS35 mitochondrial conserved domain-containing protein n=1 Tax=Cronartium quercuum f. sp. fusiforme G11 TaxID=708437 RepID=A0A9P6NXH0_9BASI|nr:hypothetical protein CROQUDRAFT_719395 [Cronartium quercuum f. sp. fusiforme G11]